MELAMIVAQSTNRVIGIENELPWRLPKDLQYFKRVTLGKPVIMGRKTYESIGRPLPERANIVISSNRDYVVDGVTVVHSLEEAISAANKLAKLDKSIAEIMVIGGAQIYQQALPLARTLYITQVEAHLDGDAHFPEVDFNHYKETARESYTSDDTNPYDYSFITYVKKEQSILVNESADNV